MGTVEMETENGNGKVKLLNFIYTYYAKLKHHLVVTSIMQTTMHTVCTFVWGKVTA